MLLHPPRRLLSWQSCAGGATISTTTLMVGTFGWLNDPPNLEGRICLTHAIEGYTTKAAWEIPDMFHLEAIKLISGNLRGAVENTPEGRKGMALAQYIAGMGFSNVGLGIAHSIAHTLGAHYDTPHDVACAMMLLIVMEYNKEYTGERFKEIARAMGVEGVDSMTQEEYR